MQENIVCGDMYYQERACMTLNRSGMHVPGHACHRFPERRQTREPVFDTAIAGAAAGVQFDAHLKKKRAGRCTGPAHL